MPRRLALQRMTFSDLLIGTQRCITGFVSYRKAEVKSKNIISRRRRQEWKLTLRSGIWVKLPLPRL